MDNVLVYVVLPIVTTVVGGLIVAGLLAKRRSIIEWTEKQWAAWRKSRQRPMSDAEWDAENRKRIWNDPSAWHGDRSDDD